MKVSIVITILNEESTIDFLLAGLAQQTTLPNEVVIVDGGSTDESVKIIKQWQKNTVIGKKISLLRKKGNRSIGRNHGITKAKHAWIAITDAGCIPATNWLAELIKTHQKNKHQVVAGYYLGLPTNGFQQAVVPYVLVMPDKVNPDNFLPATRSMMIHRSVWRKMGKFDTNLDHNEDYAFAKQLEKNNIPITFTDQAIVGWLPRTNLISFYQMILRFALGDIQAGILRPKVTLIFARYILLIYLALIGGELLPSLILLYLIWAVLKNSRYLTRGRFWLPVLQVTADLAVMTGSTKGLLERVFKN